MRGRELDLICLVEITQWKFIMDVTPQPARHGQVVHTFSHLILTAYWLPRKATPTTKPKHSVLHPRTVSPPETLGPKELDKGAERCRKHVPCAEMGVYFEVSP